MEDVKQLKAIEEIKVLKARYFRAVDMKDWDLLRVVLSDDVTVDFRGSTMDPSTGKSAVPVTGEKVIHGSAAAEAIKTALIGVVSVHHGHMPEIEITGETTATGLWPMSCFLKFPAGSELSELIGYGHYHETYEHKNGAWKIKTLKLTRLRLDIIRN